MVCWLIEFYGCRLFNAKSILYANCSNNSV